MPRSKGGRSSTGANTMKVPGMRSFKKDDDNNKKDSAPEKRTVFGRGSAVVKPAWMSTSGSEDSPPPKIPERKRVSFADDQDDDVDVSKAEAPATTDHRAQEEAAAKKLIEKPVHKTSSATRRSAPEPRAGTGNRKFFGTVIPFRLWEEIISGTDKYRYNVKARGVFKGVAKDGKAGMKAFSEFIGDALVVAQMNDENRRFHFDTIDFSENNLTSLDASEMMTILSMYKVCVRKLMFFKNNLCDDFCIEFAHYIESQHGVKYQSDKIDFPILEEVHLSHNKITSDGAVNVCKAIHKRNDLYPMNHKQSKGFSKGKGRGGVGYPIPVWVRFEYCEVRPKEVKKSCQKEGFDVILEDPNLNPPQLDAAKVEYLKKNQKMAPISMPDYNFNKEDQMFNMDKRGGGADRFSSYAEAGGKGKGKGVVFSGLSGRGGLSSGGRGGLSSGHRASASSAAPVKSSSASHLALNEGFEDCADWVQHGFCKPPCRCPFAHDPKKKGKYIPKAEVIAFINSRGYVVNILKWADESRQKCIDENKKWSSHKKMPIKQMVDFVDSRCQEIELVWPTQQQSNESDPELIKLKEKHFDRFYDFDQLEVIEKFLKDTQTALAPALQKFEFELDELITDLSARKRDCERKVPWLSSEKELAPWHYDKGAKFRGQLCQAELFADPVAKPPGVPDEDSSVERAASTESVKTSIRELNLLTSAAETSGTTDDVEMRSATEDLAEISQANIVEPTVMVSSSKRSRSFSPEHTHHHENHHLHPAKKMALGKVTDAQPGIDWNAWKHEGPPINLQADTCYFWKTQGRCSNKDPNKICPYNHPPQFGGKLREMHAKSLAEAKKCKNMKEPDDDNLLTQRTDAYKYIKKNLKYLDDVELQVAQEELAVPNPERQMEFLMKRVKHLRAHFRGDEHAFALVQTVFSEWWNFDLEDSVAGWRPTISILPGNLIGMRAPLEELLRHLIALEPLLSEDLFKNDGASGRASKKQKAKSAKAPVKGQRYSHSALGTGPAAKAKPEENLNNNDTSEPKEKEAEVKEVSKEESFVSAPSTEPQPKREASEWSEEKIVHDVPEFEQPPP